MKETCWRPTTWGTEIYEPSQRWQCSSSSHEDTCVCFCQKSARGGSRQTILTKTFCQTHNGNDWLLQKKRPVVEENLWFKASNTRVSEWNNSIVLRFQRGDTSSCLLLWVSHEIRPEHTDWYSAYEQQGAMKLNITVLIMNRMLHLVKI